MGVQAEQITNDAYKRFYVCTKSLLRESLCRREKVVSSRTTCWRAAARRPAHTSAARQQGVNELVETRSRTILCLASEIRPSSRPKNQKLETFEHDFEFNGRSIPLQCLTAQQRNESCPQINNVRQEFAPCLDVLDES